MIKLQHVADSIYFVIICAVKVSILLLYLRTFSGNEKLRYVAYGLLFLLNLTNL